MGRGPDLTGVERAIIHAKIMANWDSEKNRIKHGKIYETLMQNSTTICLPKTVAYST